jgi:hypothetical protein
VIVDAACSKNSCLNNCVKPNSKDSGTQGKFVPMCHHCRPDAHQCLEASNSSRLHLSGHNGKSSGLSSEFEKNPALKYIRPDDVAIPSGRHSVFDKH